MHAHKPCVYQLEQNYPRPPHGRVAAGCCEATAVSAVSEEVAGVVAGCCVDTAASMASEDGVVVDVADGSFVAEVGCSRIAVSGEERMVKSLRQKYGLYDLIAVLCKKR